MANCHQKSSHASVANDLPSLRFGKALEKYLSLFFHLFNCVDKQFLQVVLTVHNANIQTFLRSQLENHFPL